MWPTYFSAAFLGLSILWQALHRRAKAKEACEVLDTLASELEQVTRENSDYSTAVLSLQAALEEMRERLDRTETDNRDVYACLAEKEDEVERIQGKVSLLVDALEDTMGQLESSQSALKNALAEKARSDADGLKQRDELSSSMKQCIEEGGTLGIEKMNELYEAAGLNPANVQQGAYSMMSKSWRETYNGRDPVRGSTYPFVSSGTTADRLTTFLKRGVDLEGA